MHPSAAKQKFSSRDSAHSPLRPRAPPTPLGCSDPGVVESLLEEAGLTVVDQGEATYHLTFRDLDHAVTTHPSAGPSKR